jgi:pseudouridine synthase
MVAGHTARVGEAVPGAATVTLDGAEVRPPQASHYIILNKPLGYVCSRTRQGTAPTIYELLPPGLRHLRLAGRLDADSSGLVLLSDDGSFIQRHSHPSQGKIKVYQLRVNPEFNPKDRARLAAGVDLKDGPSHVQVLEARGGNVTVSMAEGRNRQLRRTFGALGYRMLKLHRTAVGDYLLGGLAGGSWTEVEVQ